MDVWSDNIRNMTIIGGSSAIGQALKPYFPDAEYLSSQDYDVCHAQAIEDNIVINLSGISDENDLSGYSVLTNNLVSVNCIGAVNILASCLQFMRKNRYGRIIFFSSICSSINLTGHGVYSASKAFIDKLVKIAALENAQYGITVNSIQLGYTGIGMSQNTPENMNRQINKTAMKRFVTPREIANVIEFMIKTGYYTGQNLKLEGGIK